MKAEFEAIEFEVVNLTKMSSRWLHMLLAYRIRECNNRGGGGCCKARVEGVMIQHRLGLYKLVVNVCLLCEDRGTDRLQRMSRA